ncbi:MAG TPA: class I SAM-dependent methyltransferase [Vicinamibacterales bacterium]
MTRVVSALSGSPLGRLLGLQPPRILGTIDEPGPRQPYASWLDVRGWALATDGSPLEIVVEVGGKVVCPSVARGPRADVQALFPKLRGSGECGFHVRLDRSVLPDVRHAELVVRARLRGRPDAAQVIGSSIIERHDGFEGTFDRTAYAQVWDGAAQSAEQARTSVCGTADLAEWQRTGEATASDVAQLAEVTPQDDVLEIGCGAGRVGRFLAPKCRSWIGADVSANMLRFAEESLGDFPNVSFRKLTGYDLSGIPDASLDVVYCTGVFMHLDEWERYRYVRDARRVLRPKGRIYVDNFNLLTDEGWALFSELLEVDPSKRPPNVSRHSTPQELETYLRRAGYEDVRVRTGGLWVTAVGRTPVS